MQKKKIKFQRAYPILSQFCLFPEESLSQEHSSCHSFFTLANLPLLPSPLKLYITSHFSLHLFSEIIGTNLIPYSPSTSQRDNTVSWVAYFTIGCSFLGIIHLRLNLFHGQKFLLEISFQTEQRETSSVYDAPSFPCHQINFFQHLISTIKWLQLSNWLSGFLHIHQGHCLDSAEHVYISSNLYSFAFC